MRAPIDIPLETSLGLPMLRLALPLLLTLPALAQLRFDPVARTEVIRISGQTYGDDFGWSVAGAGDVDGDGRPDLFVGAPSQPAGGGYAGRAYLFSGTLSARTGAGSAQAILTGEGFGDNLGIAVAPAGDVDADGRGDLLVGARGHDGAGIQAGRVYLFHGPLQGNLSVARAEATISGLAYEELGWALAHGDLDADGVEDIVMGAPRSAGSAGRCYVFFGPVSGAHSVAQADLSISGVLPDEQLGSALTCGDLNGDGFDDLVLGAPRFPLNFATPGRVYVFFGPLQAGAFDALAADALFEGEQLNDALGRSVSIGDVTGDGLPDLLAGADQYFNPGAGKAYVFPGPLASGSFAAGSAASSILAGRTSDDAFGTSLVAAGDVNGDGLGDLVVGAPSRSQGNLQNGRVYIFLGPLTRALIPAQRADISIPGGPSNRLGSSVAAVGDLDGDGHVELLLGGEGDEGVDPPGVAFLVRVRF